MFNVKNSGANAGIFSSTDSALKLATGHFYRRSDGRIKKFQLFYLSADDFTIRN